MTRRGAGTEGRRAGAREWLRNRFWLVLPLLALNAALTPALPSAYRPETFDAGLPAWLLLAEILLRVLVTVAPLLMPLPERGAARPVLALYAAGVLSYAAAWAAVILAPDSGWSTSLPGFTAPAWTSLVWLAGIGARSRMRFVRHYRPWMYLVAAVAFTAVHTAHATWAWGYAVR